MKADRSGDNEDDELLCVTRGKSEEDCILDLKRLVK